MLVLFSKSLILILALALACTLEYALLFFLDIKGLDPWDVIAAVVMSGLFYLPGRHLILGSLLFFALINLAFYIIYLGFAVAFGLLGVVYFLLYLFFKNTQKNDQSSSV